MITFNGNPGLTELDKKVLPMSSDICYPSLRYIHSQKEREFFSNLLSHNRLRAF
jgi:hypothetical protein